MKRASRALFAAVFIVASAGCENRFPLLRGHSAARSVRSCGAVGNGRNDDTQAIARCWRLAEGGPIYYPAGRYVDFGSHDVGTGQIVFGDGARVSAIISRSKQPALVLQNANSWTVRDLSVEGGAGALAIGSESGFDMLGLVSGVEISKSSGDAVVISGAWNLSFRQVRVSGSRGAAFRIGKSRGINPAHLSFDSCVAENNRGPAWVVSTPDLPPSILGLNWINCTATRNAAGYDLTNVIDATWLQSYSAGDSTGVGARLNRVTGATFIGGGFHTEVTAIDASASVVTVNGGLLEREPAARLGARRDPRELAGLLHRESDDALPRGRRSHLGRSLMSSAGAAKERVRRMPTG